MHETRIATSLETRDIELLQPVSSRPLKQESEPTTTQAPPLKPQTFVDAKQAREESKPVRVSGGIFRPTGNHTIVTRTPSETASSARESTRPTPSNSSMPGSPKPPASLFQFTKSWDSLQSDTDKWNLIRVSYTCKFTPRQLILLHPDNLPIFRPSTISSLVGTGVA